MMGVVPGSISLWILILVIGIGIFGIRLSFIQLHAYFNGIPPAVERALKLVPVAIISAIVFPDVFVIEGSLTSVDSMVGVVTSPRVFAAGVGVVTARLTRSILATVGTGMAALWAIRFLIG